MRRIFMMYNDAFELLILPYDPSRHRGRKFLYYIDPDGNETLRVTGRSTLHMLMHESFDRHDGTIDVAFLRGAGAIKPSSNSVVNWYSEGFDLQTPEELKPRILELLAMPPE